MICPNCGSEHVTVHAVEEFQFKAKHHALFGHEHQKFVSTSKSVCVCQNCGSQWDASESAQPQPALGDTPETRPSLKLSSSTESKDS